MPVPRARVAPHIRYAYLLDSSSDNTSDARRMSFEVIDISQQHRQLLDRLGEPIPDLDPESPESLQRIFGLGLIALTMQITTKARAQDKDNLVEELGVLAREMVCAEDWSK